MEPTSGTARPADRAGSDRTPADESAQSPKIGVRSTRQRKAVIAAMNEITKFSSAKDIHQVLEGRGDKVGLTTVYRTLQSLSEVKAVDVLHTDGGEALYRLCGDHHHHHLVCTDCGEKDPDYTQPTEPSDPTKPSEPTEPSETTQPTEEPETTKPATDPEGPDQTGEGPQVIILVVVLVVSAACLVFVIWKAKKSKTK